MNWNDLKKCNIDDVVGYINEQLEIKSMRKIAEDLGLKDDSTVRKFITGKGYKRINNKYVIKNGEKDDTSNLRSVTSKNSIDDSSITDAINIPNLKDNLLFFNKEAETLKNMIDWFKSQDAKCMTNVIEVKEGIKIDLPDANIKRTTIRINETIWDNFDKFVEDNRPYEKHTLMAQALKEFIEKYS